MGEQSSHDGIVSDAFQERSVLCLKKGSFLSVIWEGTENGGDIDQLVNKIQFKIFKKRHLNAARWKAYIQEKRGVISGKLWIRTEQSCVTDSVKAG